MGIFLLAWTIFTISHGFGEARAGQRRPLHHVSVLLIAFVLLTLGALLEQTPDEGRGYLGSAAAAAWYTSAAGVMSATTFRRVAMTHGPRSR